MTANNARSNWAVWAQSAVNGALGDYLHAEHNPLAIAMGLYANQKLLRLERAALLALQPPPAARIALFVHGLGCSESMWNWREPNGDLTSYGSMLQAQLGYTPICVRYNTGLSIAANGRQLAKVMEAFAAAYPLPIAEILLIGHSMGGLVIRYACYEASANLSTWVDAVHRIIYLGTPHEGANLERLAHIAATTLQVVPNPITRLVGNMLNLRSQGVQDLRHGAQFGAGDIAAPGEPLPWLRSAQHYLVAGTVGGSISHPASVLFGDGLVHPPGPQRGPAAMGAAAELPPEAHVQVFPGIRHMGLARSHAVYAQIQAWCTNDYEQEEDAR